MVSDSIDDVQFFEERFVSRDSRALLLFVVENTEGFERRYNLFYFLSFIFHV